jgi:hypothetical protein
MPSLLTRAPVRAAVLSISAVSFLCAVAQAGIVGAPNDPVGRGMPAVNGATLPAPAPGAGVLRVKATTDYGVPNNIGAFRVTCRLSHMAFDDPIVYPGQPNRSHLHAFFGNTDTDANSTTNSLLTTGNSTCDGGIANRSAYWVPALIDTATGAPVKPRTLIVYYKQGYSIRDSRLMNLVPLGLKMIAGNPANSVDVKATVPWTPSPYTWKCIVPGHGSPVAEGQQIPDCAQDSELWMSVTFPQCWDGINLDSPDHRSHMSYPVNGACPATHPKALPEISYQVVYPVAAANAPLKWRLASDKYDESIPGGRSAHADYDMAWQKDIIDAAVRNCVQASKDCHADLLGDGRTLY